MRLVGITGKAGAGKSTLCKQLTTAYGIPHFNSDSRIKALIATDPAIHLGMRSLLPNGFVDNTFKPDLVRTQVLSNPELLGKINALIIPSLRDEYLNWGIRQTAAYGLVEFALIREMELENDFVAVILVHAPEYLRVEKLIDRGLDTKTIALLAAQQTAVNPGTLQVDMTQPVNLEKLHQTIQEITHEFQPGMEI